MDEQKARKTGQSPVDADMAEAGHGGIHKGAYKGNPAAAGGILGMLATIQSDFERTIKQTTEEEETSRSDFAAFSKETKASIKSNEQGLENPKGDLEITSSDIVQSLYDLRENQVPPELAELVECLEDAKALGVPESFCKSWSE